MVVSYLVFHSYSLVWYQSLSQKGLQLLRGQKGTGSVSSSSSSPEIPARPG